MHPTHHVRREAANEPNAERDVIGAPEDLGFHGPVPYDRPWSPVNTVELAPVINLRLGEDHEMQSGADQASGVHNSDISGRDYSREQGVGRSPGWQWPWNFHSLAFNFDSLTHVNPERSGLALADPHSGLNPEVGVIELPYSPIAAMDQYTTYYENDPDQHHYWPTPVSIPEVGSEAYTDVAVLT